MKRVEKESVSVDVVKLNASLIGLVKLVESMKANAKKRTSEQLRKLVYPQPPKDNLH